MDKTLFNAKLDPEQAYAVFERKPKLVLNSGDLFMGVTSTGIFCRPGCPARLPKRENCRFYASAQEALSEGFRACKRCHPTRLPGEASVLVKTLIDLVEEDPQHRWGEQDLYDRGIDPSTARRQFNARFGMTFSQYARSRRLGLAQAQLATGETVIEAQISAGYESASGFRFAFATTFGTNPKNVGGTPFMVEWIDTPLGTMIAVCDETALYLLEFTDRKALPKQFGRLMKVYGRAIVPGRTAITHHIQRELKAYFEGDLQAFKTPMHSTGTDFQKQIWEKLCSIPYGETWSYADLAVAVGNTKAVRAVAGANASNGMALIIPCHRVVRTGGHLGGYAGGLGRKNWLLSHEAKNKLRS